MLDMEGYCTIRKDAECKFATDPKRWRGKDCIVLEFTDTDLLVVHPDQKDMAMIERKDVYRWFKCEDFMGVLVPPDTHPYGKIRHYNRVMRREGGYTPMLKQIVIQASLSRGKLDDSLLFRQAEAKEQTDQLAKEKFTCCKCHKEFNVNQGSWLPVEKNKTRFMNNMLAKDAPLKVFAWDIRPTETITYDDFTCYTCQK